MYICTRNYALLRVFAHIFGYNLVILLKKKKRKEKKKDSFSESFSQRKKIHRINLFCRFTFLARNLWRFYMSLYESSVCLDGLHFFPKLKRNRNRRKRKIFYIILFRNELRNQYPSSIQLHYHPTLEDPTIRCRWISSDGYLESVN